jgi:hypothetical protein
VIRPGDQVGARRWPGAGGHPDTWGQPWCGTVLSLGDPAAWEGTAALGAAPTQAAVDAHLAGPADALPGETLPVRWAFPGGDRVYWERRAALVPYHKDYAACCRHASR